MYHLFHQLNKELWIFYNAGNMICKMRKKLIPNTMQWILLNMSLLNSNENLLVLFLLSSKAIEQKQMSYRIENKMKSTVSQFQGKSKGSIWAYIQIQLSIVTFAKIHQNKINYKMVFNSYKNIWKSNGFVGNTH